MTLKNLPKGINNWEKMKILSKRVSDGLDRDTGLPLNDHPNDKEWLQQGLGKYRVTNKEGKNYDDRGRVDVLTQKQKKIIKEQFPYIKFGRGIKNCPHPICEHLSESGRSHAVAQFRLVQDQSPHGLGYFGEGDVFCFGCLGFLFCHSEEYDPESDNQTDMEQDAEMNTANYELSDFKDPKYKEEFEEHIFLGTVTIEYDPNGFKEDDY